MPWTVSLNPDATWKVCKPLDALVMEPVLVPSMNTSKYLLGPSSFTEQEVPWNFARMVLYDQSNPGAVGVVMSNLPTYWMFGSSAPMLVWARRVNATL